MDSVKSTNSECGLGLAAAIAIATSVLSGFPPAFAATDNPPVSSPAEPAAKTDTARDPFGGPVEAEPPRRVGGGDPFGSDDSRAGPPDESTKSGPGQRKRSPETKASKRIRDGTSIYASFTKREREILQGLEETSEFSYLESPLIDVLSDITFRHDLPLMIDSRALRDDGVGTDSPVTVNLQSVSLRAGLSLILADLDLGYVVTNDVLLVTTGRMAAKRPQIRVYRIDALAGDSSGEELVDLLRKLPEGKAAIGSFRGQLVVKGSFPDQQRIIDVLKALEK